MRRVLFHGTKAKLTVGGSAHAGRPSNCRGGRTGSHGNLAATLDAAIRGAEHGPAWRVRCSQQGCRFF
ncbi:NAD(+)--rifampin ADP-ribosyltransferase [Leifsonia kafniensis]|uniref:NAD(+)--rifampin ADP-ribosyltransferase n=1 Tax=Leifsonia kafniensis TaxID=475957 RepID=UPI003CD09E74